MGHRLVPAPFLAKTYELVDDQATNEVISWGENGTTFVVWKTAEFAKDLLPKCFKHNNFSSFVRQLNTYGFRKIAPDKWEFSNDNFKRWDKSLLVKIHRRKAITSPPAKLANDSQTASGDNTGSTSLSSPDVIDVADLSGENEKLKRDNQKLSLELARAKKQRDELIFFLTRHLSIGPEEIDRALRSGLLGRLREGVVANNVNDDDENDANIVHGANERNKIEEEGPKLFGVRLKEVDGIERLRKRRCGDIQVDSTDNKNAFGSLNVLDCGRKIMRTR